MANKTLFKCEVSFTYYAYSDDETEAEEYVRDALNDGSPDIFVREVTDKNHRPLGEWDRGCLVYHNEGTDITLGEALDSIGEDDDDA